MQTAVCAIFSQHLLSVLNSHFYFFSFIVCEFLCSFFSTQIKAIDFAANVRGRISFCRKHSLNYVNNEHHKFILMKCVHEQFQAHLVPFSVYAAHIIVVKRGRNGKENPWSTNDTNELEFFSNRVCVYFCMFDFFSWFHFIITIY